MKRGSQSLFADIFYAETPVVQLIPKRGRNSDLDDKRNECLVDRYYYTAKTKKPSYQDLINSIAQQFFISPTTAFNVIQANKSQLLNLRADDPDKKYFMEKWPHLVW